ncbi:hypothetical protein ACKI1Q_35055 [Streptomyces galilaeus]|uniref:hypothetical protein n=1 Tax=Streptomyces galilaeus TaxID=33899 RepID=UPI0038F7D083
MSPPTAPSRGFSEVMRRGFISFSLRDASRLRKGPAEEEAVAAGSAAAAGSWAWVEPQVGWLRFQRLPGAGRRQTTRQGRGRQGRRGREFLDVWLHWAARVQANEGLLGPAAGLRGIVAFVVTGEFPATESVGEQRLVAKCMGDFHHAAASLGTRIPGELQMHATASVEVLDDLFVCHQSSS